MAGIHFIILKVNGVDVSQMPHGEAVQMFLKASEPILVEVRRRSYNSNSIESDECAEKSLPNDSTNQQENINLRRQSPTISPAKHQKISCESPTALDSLKFHNLIISSSQSSIGLDNSAKIKSENHVNSSESLPIPSTRNNNNCASTSSPHPLSYYPNNKVPYADDSSKQITIPLRCESISSALSPTKSLHPQSTTSSPFKEIKPTTIYDETQRKPSKGLISIGIQTDNFTTDFIFSGSSMLNSEQIIENDHNLFSECMAPEIDIEEITLRKSESNERLGLTVCYSSGGGNGSGSDDTDTCTEVYISDIVPDSIAGRDGRLRQGDQILQVNGKDVSNKEETETLIAENNNAVTLLVSRYLYGDDDEFNEQGDYYDDDEPNMAYGNCFLGNYILTEGLPKSAKSSHDNSPVKKNPIEELLQNEPVISDHRTLDTVLPSMEVMAATPSISSIDPLNHQNIKAHLEQVNQEIAMLDSRVENMMSQHAKPLKNVESSVTKKLKEENATSAMQVMDYDTEHIYETIPEDSESEPFYCSPYEGSEHKTRIEQWLGMQDGSNVNENKMRSLPHKQQQNHDNLAIWTKPKNGTVRSTNSSAGDDHENSSSAYNTGGSCNSNTMTPLTLELNANYRDREQNSTSTLILCSSKHAVSPINETTILNRLPVQNSSHEVIDSAKLSHHYLKEKLLSPTHPSKVSQIAANKQKLFTIPQKTTADVGKSTSQTGPISANNTMYTNVANLQQTMLLQQQLFRQALIHQRVPSNSVPCPQFTAPNLSQYHFVSSQEVSTVKLKTHPNEEHMVWKVKRRQDGSRYIVRRPARNRFLRNRALRISAERNDQTTEDDTISEIKTGRYWTREERKKHIERARERRQRQQIIITHKNNEISPSLLQQKIPEIIPKTSNEKLFHINSELPQQQQTDQPKTIQSLHTLNTTTMTKVYRQSTPTGQSLNKKQIKKTTTYSPLEIATSVSANTNSIATGTIKTPATTPSGNKMVGLLSVTTV